MGEHIYPGGRIARERWGKGVTAAPLPGQRLAQGAYNEASRLEATLLDRIERGSETLAGLFRGGHFGKPLIRIVDR